MKTSKVLVANFSRQFESKYGTMYVHQIIFENQDSGEYNSKAQVQDKFVVGQEATYEIEPNVQNPQFPARIKPVNPEYTGSKGGGFKGKDSPEQRRSIERQTSMNRAIDLAVAKIAKGGNPSLNDIRTDAIAIYDWISKGETSKEQTLNEEYKEKTGIPGVTVDDEPPF